MSSNSFESDQGDSDWEDFLEEDEEDNEDDEEKPKKANESAVAAYLLSGRVKRFLDANSKVSEETNYFLNLRNFTGSICFADSLIQALASIDCLQTKKLNVPSFNELKKIMAKLRTPTKEKESLIIKNFYQLLGVDFSDAQEKYNQEWKDIEVANIQMRDSSDFKDYFKRQREKNKALSENRKRPETLFFRDFLKESPRNFRPKGPDISTTTMKEFFNDSGSNSNQSDAGDLLQWLIEIYNPVFEPFNIRSIFTNTCPVIKEKSTNESTIPHVNLIMNTAFLEQPFFGHKFNLNIDTSDASSFCWESTKWGRKPKVLHVHVKEEKFDVLGQVVYLKLNRTDNDIATSRTGGRSSNEFRFPEIFEKNGHWYTLKSVICHQGKSSSGGHYITYGIREGGWYKFDDISVATKSISSFKDVQELSAKTCVFFFYERV